MTTYAIRCGYGQTVVWRDDSVAEYDDREKEV